MIESIYYVAPGRNDGNSGTFEQPFVTMNKAQQVSQPNIFSKFSAYSTLLGFASLNSTYEVENVIRQDYKSRKNISSRGE